MRSGMGLFAHGAWIPGLWPERRLLWKIVPIVEMGLFPQELAVRRLTPASVVGPEMGLLHHAGWIRRPSGGRSAWAAGIVLMDLSTQETGCVAVDLDGVIHEVQSHNGFVHSKLKDSGSSRCWDFIPVQVGRRGIGSLPPGGGVSQPSRSNSRSWRNWSAGAELGRCGFQRTWGQAPFRRQGPSDAVLCLSRRNSGTRKRAFRRIRPQVAELRAKIFLERL